MKVYFNRKTGIIALQTRKCRHVFDRYQREQAYDLIRKSFGKHLGRAIVDDIKKKLA